MLMELLNRQKIFVNKVMTQMDNKRKSVADFVLKGERLLTDPNCPIFLEGHVQKLKEAWEDTERKVQLRREALNGETNKKLN
jgi:hypothetical protein